MLQFCACANFGESLTTQLKCINLIQRSCMIDHPPPALRLLRDVDSWTMKEVRGGEQGDFWARIDGIIRHNSAMT